MTIRALLPTQTSSRLGAPHIPVNNTIPVNFFEIVKFINQLATYQ
jgi:hypothetical protein